MQAVDRADPHAGEAWAAAPPRSRIADTLSAAMWRIWDAVVGPSGWRSLIGPIVFAVLGIGLLIYDHLNDRVTDVVFWLTLTLIVTVFVRMLETNRRQSQALDAQRRDSLSDQVTALPNRRQLEADIEACANRSGGRRVLVLLELEGLQTYNDRFGYAAGDEVLKRSAQSVVKAVVPLGGVVYRFGAARLAALVPYGERPLNEVRLLATEWLREEESDPTIGRSYGEVAIPDETTDAETAFQLAGQRLDNHKQRQHRSSRRQVHAALMAALTARRPELRDHLRTVAYRAISLGRRLAVGAAEIDDIALASELQQVGLLAAPELPFEEETAMAEDRIVESERIVAAAPGLAPVARLVRSSGERFDGSGHPDGLAGEAIPLGARIISVSVAFAALTSQPHCGPGDALAELQRRSGSQFDPRVVAALAEDLAEEAAPVPVPVPAA